MAQRKAPTPEPVEGAASPAAGDSESRILRARAWLTAAWPTSRRKQFATVAALLAIFVATFVASSRLLRFVFEDLDILAYGGLAIACWIGAGGALVPIPGVRMLSWLMIVQQGAALNPFVVAAIAAFAMTLGQSSYFLASRTASAHIREHHEHRLEDESEQSPGQESQPAPRQPPSRRAELMERAKESIESQLEKHSMATVFVVSALPTPLTTVTTSAAASLGMSYAKYAIAALGGFLLLAAALAGIGQAILQGLRTLLNF